MFYKTEDLITAAKRSEFFPVGQTTFSDPDDLIAFANEEMQTKLAPAILSVREDFFLTSSLIALQQNLPTYQIPERAMGNALKDLLFVPNASDTSSKYPIPKTTVHDLSTGGLASGTPAAFYLQGDQIVLDRTPSSTLSALMAFFFMRPNQLVSTSNCAKITAITVGASQTTLNVDTDLTPATLTNPIATGSLVDLLSAKSPFVLWNRDVVVQTIISTTIVLNNTDVQDAALNTLPKVGDYICPAQRANIPMIPQEFHPILSEMIAWRALKAIGDKASAAAVKAHIDEMLAAAFKMISMRVEQEMDVVFDSGSILNSIGFSNFTFFR